MSRSTTGEVDPDPGSNTLVLVPSTELEPESLIDSFHRFSSSKAEMPVLIVTASCSPTEILDRWRTHTTERPSLLAIVSLSDRNGLPVERSTSTIDGVSVTSIPVSDLTAVASSIDDYLTEWCDDAVPLLWFDSITSLLRTTSLETSFRFLHLLTKRVQITGTIAYYQLDATAYDREIVSSLTPLFDSVLE